MAEKNAFSCDDPIEVRKDRKPAYHIYPEDSFAHLAKHMQELDCAGRRIAVITDSNVEKLYLQEVLDALGPVCGQVHAYTLPAGEEHKNLDEIRGIYEDLIAAGLDRNDLLVALGGGVVGDMTGFAAATYLRGIRFVQIPTTLLSQVDSSIGGKTGVDFDAYKNMVGAFHQPAMVYLNTGTLRTLSDEQFASGMGEVLKHGLIRDAAYYEWCLDHMEEIEERDPSVLKEMVVRSVHIKRRVVEKDPTEKGERAILNFGHTVGHAIEKQLDFRLTHGACVALGITAASYISWKRGNIDEMTFFEIRDMFVGFDLPISFEGPTAEEVLAAAKKDKKMDAGRNRFILLRKLGSAYIDDTVTDSEILDAVQFIRYDG